MLLTMLQPDNEIKCSGNAGIRDNLYAGGEKRGGQSKQVSLNRVERWGCPSANLHTAPSLPPTGRYVLKPRKHPKQRLVERKLLENFQSYMMTVPKDTDEYSLTTFLVVT